ncbi:hypothetical protein GGR94_003885, partial [Sulfitobacter geojensis]
GAAIADAGAVVVNGGTFEVLANETIGTLEGAGGVDVNANTLTVAGTGDKTFSGALSGSGVLSKTNSGTLTLTGDNSALTGGMQIGAGVIDGNSDAAFGTGLITLNGGTMAVSGTTTVSNGIAVGAGNGVITGADATLTGAITATGALTFGNGTDAAQVVVNSTTASAAAATTVSELATVVLGTSQSVNLFANGGVVDGTLDLKGNDISFSSLTGTGVVTSNAAATATVTINGATTFDGAFKDGAPGGVALYSDAGLGNIFTLNTADSDYSGDTTVNSGTLRVSGGGAIGDSSAVTVNTSAVLDVMASETVASIEGAGSVTVGTGSALTVAGDASTTFNGIVSGTGGLTVGIAPSTGALTLTNENTYTGATTVESGTLFLGNANTLVDSGAVVVNGTLDLMSTDETIGSLAGNGTGAVHLNGNTLTVAGTGTAATTDFNGVIDGTGKLVVNNDTDTLRLGGVNIHTGGTDVEGGTLALTGTGALANVNLNDGAFQTAGTVSGTATIAGGIMTVTGGTVTTATNNDGVLDINAGTVTTVNSAATTTNSGTVTTAVVTGATFTNEAAGSVGTANVSGGTFSTAGTVTGSVNNNGAAVAVTGGSVASLVNSAGSATISGGNVTSMSNSATASNAGSVGTLSQGGGSFANSGGITTATISGGTFTTSGSVGTLENAGGSSTVQSGTVATANNTAGSLNIAGGSVGALTSSASTTNAGGVGTANIAGGSFANSGTVSGTTTIGGGTVDNTGTLAAVDLSGGTLTSTAGTVGTVTNAGGSVNINGGTAGPVANTAGTLTVASAGSTGAVTNSGTASNAGTVEALNNLEGTFDNTGTISGETTVAGGAVTNSGTMANVTTTGGSFSSTAGSIGDISINGGTVELSGGTVGGVDNAAGSLTLGLDAGAVTNSATLILTGSATSLNNTAGSTTVSGTVSGPTNLSGGQLTNTGDLNGGVTVTAGTFDSTGTILGTVDASGGTVNLAGRLNGSLEAGDGEVTITGSLSDVNSITNNGSGSLTIASGTTSLDNGGIVVNTGTMTIGGRLAGTGALANAGTLEISTGGTVAMNIANDGTLAAEGAITGDLVNNSGRTATIAGVMTGDVVNAASGEVTIAGTQTGTIDNDGTVLVTGTNIGGVINNEQLTVASGGTVEGDIINSAVLELDGEVTGDVINNGSAPAASTARLRIGDGAIVTLSGGVSGDFENASDLNLRGRVDGILSNTGLTTLQEGISTVGTIVNDETFLAEVGTLNFGSFTNNADVTLRNGGILSGGSFLNAADLTVGNGGQFTSGTLTNNANLTLPGGAVIGADVVNNGVITATGTNQAGGTLTNAQSGVINMADGATGDVITVTGDAVLNGRITADIDLSPDNQGFDEIRIDGVLSGDVLVDFNDLSEEFGTLNGGLTVLSFGALADDFTFDQTGLPANGALVYGFKFDAESNSIAIESGANPAVAGIASGLTLTQSLINTVVNRPSSPFVAGLAAEDDDPCGFGSWARGVGGVADANGETATSIGNFNSEISASYGGLQVGFDYSCFDSRYAGFDLSFGGIIGANAGSLSQPVFRFDPTTVSLDRSQTVSENKTDFNQTYAGAYIGASRGRLFGDIQLRFDQTAFDLKNTAFVDSATNGGLDDLGVADQEYDSTSTTISGSVGYAFPLSEASGLVFVPAVGVSHSRTSVDNLRFDGGTPDIAGDDGFLEIDDIVSTVGFVSATLSRSKILPSGTAALNMFGTVTYYHDFGDDTTSRYFALDANGLPEGEPLTTTSSNLGAYAELSIGMNYTKLLQPGAPGGARQFDASVRLDGRFSGGLDSYGITGQMRFQF